MGQSFIDNWDVQMKKGILLLLVLNIISRKGCYGKQIIDIIENETGIKMADGTLYPILKKLKSENHVVTKWITNDDETPKKYYYLTGKGGITLREMNQRWFNASQLIGNSIKS